MDETDGSGYCMYCGVKIDAADTDAEYLDPQSAELVDIVINGAEDSETPCPPELEEAVDALMSGDIVAADCFLADALTGTDKEKDRYLKDVMAEYVVRKIFRTVYEGETYDGWLSIIGRTLVVDDDPGTSEHLLIESVFDGLCQSLTVISTPGDCSNMARSLFALLNEYVQVALGPRGIGAMLDEYIAQCDVLLDLIGQMEPDDTTDAEEIGKLRDIANRMADITDEAVSGVSDEVLDRIEERRTREIIPFEFLDCVNMFGRSCAETDADDMIEWFKVYIQDYLNLGE